MAGRYILPTEDRASFPRLNDKNGKVEPVDGVKYTIKDGIIYDAKQLLKDVENMVIEQKKARE